MIGEFGALGRGVFGRVGGLMLKVGGVKRRVDSSTQWRARRSMVDGLESENGAMKGTWRSIPDSREICKLTKVGR